MLYSFFIFFYSLFASLVMHMVFCSHFWTNTFDYLEIYWFYPSLRIRLQNINYLFIADEMLSSWQGHMNRFAWISEVGVETSRSGSSNRNIKLLSKLLIRVLPWMPLLWCNSNIIIYQRVSYTLRYFMRSNCCIASIIIMHSSTSTIFF